MILLEPVKVRVIINRMLSLIIIQPIFVLIVIQIVLDYFGLPLSINENLDFEVKLCLRCD